MTRGKAGELSPAWNDRLARVTSTTVTSDTGHLVLQRSSPGQQPKRTQRSVNLSIATTVFRRNRQNSLGPKARHSKAIARQVTSLSSPLLAAQL